MKIGEKSPNQFDLHCHHQTIMPQLYQYTEKKSFVIQILKVLKERRDASAIQDILQLGIPVQTP